MLELLPAEQNLISALAILVVPAGLSADDNVPHNYYLCTIGFGTQHFYFNRAVRYVVLYFKVHDQGLKWAVRWPLQGRGGCVHVHDTQTGQIVLSSMQLCLHHTGRKRATALHWHRIRGSFVSLGWTHIWTPCMAVRPTGASLSQPEKEPVWCRIHQTRNQNVFIHWFRQRLCHTETLPRFKQLFSNTGMGLC